MSNTVNVFRGLEGIGMKDEGRKGKEDDTHDIADDCRRETLSSKTVGVILSRYRVLLITFFINRKLQ